MSQKSVAGRVVHHHSAPRETIHLDMPDEATVRDALKLGADSLHLSPAASRDAELLLMHALGRDRAWLLTHSDETLDAAKQSAYGKLIERRALLEPMQYILGEQEFYGLSFHVTPDVLIPRPETEHLVEAALVRLRATAPLRLADVGTGSGAIAVALAHSLPQANIAALDISPLALAIAAENAARHKVSHCIQFLVSDLLEAVRGQLFDAIVSNPPYVATSEELEPQVRDHEPAAALYAGESGLDIYRRLIPQAYAALKPNGWLMMEIGHGQRDAVAELLRGWSSIEFVDDLQSIPRVAIAQRPSSLPAE